MSQVIRIKIDVTKIDKKRLYVGAKGTYLNAVLFLNDQTDSYGNNGMIVESVTKEESDKGIRGAILGNAQISGAKPQTNQAQQGNDGHPDGFKPMDNDDLPF